MMKTNYQFFTWRLAAVLLIAFTTSSAAHAQFGNLKGLAGKVVKEAKREADTKVRDAKRHAKTEASKASEEAQRRAEREVKYKEAWAQLSDEQAWAVRQLMNPTDAPDQPWPLAENNKWYNPTQSIPGEYVDYFKEIDQVPMDTIQALGAAMNARYFYIMRVLEGSEGVNLSRLIEEDRDASHLKITMGYEKNRYEAFQAAGEQANLGSFFTFFVQPDANGVMAVTDDSKIGVPYGGNIAMNNGKWMFAFDYKGDKTTYVTPEAVQKCREYVDHLVKTEALLTNPNAEEQTVACIKAHYAQAVILEAIANNSPDNIVYIAYPKGGSLNTADMKAKALKIFQKGTSSKVHDVIIAGDWEYTKNVFDVVVDRFVRCYVIQDTAVGKGVFTMSVGNDRIGSGWGDLRWYGTGSLIGYVK